MWVQHVVYPAVAEEEKKDRIHDQNGGKPNWYVSSRVYAIVKMLLGFVPCR
jgi:hypothetical protein